MSVEVSSTPVTGNPSYDMRVIAHLREKAFRCLPASPPVDGEILPVEGLKG